jgi:vacuolar-type H+-ATPase subunit F/Vma7
LCVAVDFTLSNGNPADKDSLHYWDMNKNEYLNAIKSVGEVLQYYDSDKQIPAFGFGACIPPIFTNKASHCFALNGDIFEPEVDGLEGVISAYKSAIKTVNLYGPTNFAPIVELVCDMAEEEQVTQGHQKYFILLIITDGIINDMQKTIDQIVRGSSLPLSIIIVGVGSDDFENMDVLDSDEALLYSTRFKKHMEADIV